MRTIRSYLLRTKEQLPSLVFSRDFKAYKGAEKHYSEKREGLR